MGFGRKSPAPKNRSRRHTPIGFDQNPLFGRFRAVFIHFRPTNIIAKSFEMSLGSFWQILTDIGLGVWRPGADSWGWARTWPKNCFARKIDPKNNFSGFFDVFGFLGSFPAWWCMGRYMKVVEVTMREEFRLFWYKSGHKNLDFLDQNTPFGHFWAVFTHFRPTKAITKSFEMSLGSFCQILTDIGLGVWRRGRFQVVIWTEEAGGECQFSVPSLWGQILAPKWPK